MKRAIKIASICLAGIALSAILLTAAPGSYEAYVAHRCIEAKKEFVAVQMCFRDQFCGKDLGFYRTGVAAGEDLRNTCPPDEFLRAYANSQ